MGGRSRSRSRSRSRRRRRRRSPSRGEIQALVDQRQQARAARDFHTADKMRDELRYIGVTLDDPGCRWRGPKGMEGKYMNPMAREGDWPCPKCGFNNFANREDCRQCRANRYGDDRRSRSRDRRRRSDSRDRRGRDRSRDDRDRRRDSRSRSRRRRRS
eukprot:TRINITY_DN5931_c0_g3_i1.p2 TRINITY_DN5931_c0_g3~~TRINITY_DN5931_c0_g3_i1.p2  ORF type:complete len:158 (+),score=29.03 TRINITY_DN5931_c0_g3_i1:85-558(+)